MSTFLSLQPNASNDTLNNTRKITSSITYIIAYYFIFFFNAHNVILSCKYTITRQIHMLVKMQYQTLKRKLQ